jgi:hypothetical protein
MLNIQKIVFSFISIMVLMSMFGMISGQESANTIWTLGNNNYLTFSEQTN